MHLERIGGDRRVSLEQRAFNGVEDRKGRAPKPLEEAAEAFGARQKRNVRYASEKMYEAFGDELIDKCMDTVQAIADLPAAVGATQGEADAAIKRMDERNRDRGGFWEISSATSRFPCAGSSARAWRTRPS